MISVNNLSKELKSVFPDIHFMFQETKDEFPTVWIPADQILNILGYLKKKISFPFKMLFDLTAIDERARQNKTGFPDSDFTVVYLLFSFERNSFLRLKTGLKEENASLPSITELWPSANWYEREVFDMFDIHFKGHPVLRRLLMPPEWKGHPLRKEHYARATETTPYDMSEDNWMTLENSLKFKPSEWGFAESSEDQDFMFLNLGPQHPGTHGVLRLILQLDGEEIVDIVPDIGFHHRGAEKMGERQTWHTYIPYTDRIDYLSGVINNMAYLLTVEKLGGINVPARAQVIRVMLSELFRIASHLVWYGTFAQDVGQLSPVFYMFSDRERIFDIVEAITGGRMHPNWFRIGGVSQDLPEGWERQIKDFIDYFPGRLREYDKLVLKNNIFKGRTKGIGIYNTKEAIEWGVTGPGLRATGFEWDFRKKAPYSGYEQFEFDVPTGNFGDCYDRTLVRIEEMHQSLRIVEQCMKNMPAGDYQSDHPLATPPRKDHTMRNIETLINHFLNVTWGPVIPPGEAMCNIEASKGMNAYYLISDGKTTSYRTRIRTPSFPHIQMTPFISRGYTVADLLSILGSIDFVLADVDR